MVHNSFRVLFLLIFSSVFMTLVFSQESNVCKDGMFFNGTSCTLCSRVCDSRCESKQCYRYDPDCDISGKVVSGNPCDGENICCSGRCVNPNTDARNCGECGNICLAPTKFCVSGNCVACRSNYDCGGRVVGKSCQVYRCVFGLCRPMYIMNCCGNKMCEFGETNSSCPYDCRFTCGNGVCDAEEDEGICPYDCGECSGSCGAKCTSRQYTPDGCICTMDYLCCGNLICDSNETFISCPSDCNPMEISYEVILPTKEANFTRGELMPIKVLVKADGVNLTNAIVVADVFSQKVYLFDDGLYPDENKDDSIYSGIVYVGPSAQKESNMTLTISRRNTTRTGLYGFSLVQPIEIEIKTDKDTYSLGDIIRISGTVKKKGSPVRLRISLVLLSTTPLATLEAFSDENGFFNISYHSSTIDPVGIWKISADTVDEFNNTGNAAKIIHVSRPPQQTPLLVRRISPPAGVYSRGDKITITVDVTSNNTPVGNADVRVRDPRGNVHILEEVVQGTYSTTYTIGWDEPEGVVGFHVYADKIEGDKQYSGDVEFFINIKKVPINIDIIEPSISSFKVGETMPIKVRVYYPDGTPVEQNFIVAMVGDDKVILAQKLPGVYEGELFITEGMLHSKAITLNVKDRGNNVGIKTTRITITGTSITYYLEKFRSLVTIVLLVLLGIGAIYLPPVYRRYKVWALQRRKGELLAKEKRIQTQYLEERTISQRTYNKLMAEYETELEGIEKKLRDLGVENVDKNKRK